MPLDQRRQMIDKESDSPSIVRQCELLQIHRSGLYYKPVTPDEGDDKLMKLIDLMHLKDPTLGTRRLSRMLARKGYAVGRDKVRTLMRLMRIKAIYCRPRTSIPDRTKYKYPYLLNNLLISRPNQVWAIDITYIPMSKGFMYMVAIIDLYSRYIIDWSLSNTMEAAWVVGVVQNAISIHGKPEIINSDQGAQFTSDDYIELLKSNEISISMDGKGRALDNVYIERFWRTVKYERVYLCPKSTGTELYTLIVEFIEYYNNERLHESLDYQTPSEYYMKAA